MAQITWKYDRQNQCVRLDILATNISEHVDLKKWIKARKAEEPKNPCSRKHTFNYRKHYLRWRLWFDDESEATAFKITWQD